jgi:hypothetical protein
VKISYKKARYKKNEIVLKKGKILTSMDIGAWQLLV